jgi:tetratricopeptide (TPR) repeat protein
MREGSKDNFDSKEFAGVVKRYKKMLSEERVEFFDVSDFEYITDHYIDKNQLSNALQACEIALSQHPHSIIVKIKKAQVLVSQMKIDRALTLLKLLYDFEHTNPEILLMLGTCYHLKGEHDKAFEYFNLVEEYSFDDRDEMLHSIGSTYIQSGNFEKAIIFLEKAHADNPRNETALYDLAYSYDKIGEAKQSTLLYNKYLDLDPYSESAWYNLGIIYTRLEEYDKAIEAYDFALAIDEKYSSALYNKANTLSAAERYEDALKCYLEYLKFDKDSTDIQLYIAECYLQLEDFKNAIEHYKTAIQLYPKNADAWYGAGIVLMIEERLPESLVFLKKALKIDNKCADYWNAFAKINALLDKYEEALIAFQKCIELEKTNHEFWLSYADFYYQYDQQALAIQTLIEADKIRGDCAPIHYKLSGYLLEDNEEQLAKFYLKKALSENYVLHYDLLNEFPSLKSKAWARRLINKFSSKNKL